MEKLRPCPFCGMEMPKYRINYHIFDLVRDVNGILKIGSRAEDYQIICPRCGSRTAQYATEKEAIDRWNGKA